MKPNSILSILNDSNSIVSKGTTGRMVLELLAIAKVKLKRFIVISRTKNRIIKSYFFGRICYDVEQIQN